jgi:V/A-type H+/Na+-transporting ATPase subunit B
MRHGAGPGRTREDHLDVAAQIVAALARARQAHDLADLIGAAALSATDRSYIAFEDAFMREVVAQRVDENRPLDETLRRSWRCLAGLPRGDLTMIAAHLVEANLNKDGGDG